MTEQPREAKPGSLVDVSAFKARGYGFTDSLIPDQARPDADVRAAYATWSDRFLQRPSQQYINANGGGEMLFVTGFDQTFFGRTENGAVSEGIGYAWSLRL